jgi:hypothetical protein
MEQKQAKSKFYLPMYLQHFSEDPNLGGNPDDKKDDLPPNDLDDKTNTGGDPGNTADDRKFTQDDIDRIVRERLEREKRKRDEALKQQQEEAERKRLEEEQKYKELYEKLQQDLEAQKATALQVRKESMLAQAGYSEEQSKTLVKLIEGEDDDTLKASLESVKALFPPVKEKNYGDPNPGNGGKQVPKKKDLEEKGKSAYQRLKAKGKIRGGK